MDLDLRSDTWRELSNSRIKTWSRCNKQYEYKYIMGLKPKSKAIPLERGSWLHKLLEVHYDGEDWKAAHKELTEAFNGYFIEEREELGDLPAECNRIMRSYLMNYPDDRKQYKVIDTEMDEVVTLPNGLRFRLIIDKIIEESDGGLWLVDYKTVKNFMPPDFLLLDAQLARYFWGAEKLGYKPLRGIMFDEIKTQAPTVPKQLKTGGLERRKNMRCDAYTYYRELKHLGLDPKPYKEFLNYLMSKNSEWFRRTRLPKDKPLVLQQMRELDWTARQIREAEERNEFPRSVMKDCRWDCSFLELCALQLTGARIEPAIKLRYTTRSDRAEDA